jgi:hypothetical protein
VARGDLPESVRLPDGRTQPFEPERITRSLFAAGERLGRPDAFLARELTDGVLHFLSTEEASPVTTPARIAEVVGKVVRELGRPALALAYEERGRSPVAPREPGPVKLPDWATASVSPMAVHLELAREQLRAFSVTSVLPRDLVSAHEEGLIRLTGLEHPRELDGFVADLPPGAGPDAVAGARNVAGGFLAVDGPEYDLAPLDGAAGRVADDFLRPVRFAAEALGIRIVLNLNVTTPPPRLSAASGPLFEAGRDGLGERRREIAVALSERASDGCFDVWWHVPADGPDIAVPTTVLTRAIAGASTEFVFDRARIPVALGPGVDRQTPAALTRVGLNLARLVEMVGGSPVDSDVFLRKVGSLTRFAKTAGHVRLDFLRRHGRAEVREAFLLDRARLVLVPTGLEVAAPASDRGPVEFGREILRIIRTSAETDRPRVLPVQVMPILDPRARDGLLGPGASVRAQIRAASQLLAGTGAGRLELGHPERRPFTADEAGEAVRSAAESAVVRIRFARP